MTDTTTEPVVDGTTVHTRATAYTVTCLPDDPYDGSAWDIQVQFMGAHRFDEPRPVDQQWAVVLRSHWNLNRAGKWDLRASVDDDGYDGWIAAHRFDLETALKMAAEQAPHVKVNGCTPAELLAWRAER